MATVGGVPVRVTTADAGSNNSWDALGPGDLVEFTGSYIVIQTDIDTLQ